MINFDSADFDLLDNANEFEDPDEWEEDEEEFEGTSFEEQMTSMEEGDMLINPLSDLFSDDEDFNLNDDDEDAYYDDGLF